jgi:hypothetical protein
MSTTESIMNLVDAHVRASLAKFAGGKRDTAATRKAIEDALRGGGAAVMELDRLKSLAFTSGGRSFVAGGYVDPAKEPAGLVHGGQVFNAPPEVAEPPLVEELPVAERTMPADVPSFSAGGFVSPSPAADPPKSKLPRLFGKSKKI